GVGAASAPFLLSAGSLAGAETTARKQRLIILFSPNGVVPTEFWPDEIGDKFTMKESLKPLEPYQDKTLLLRGISEKVKGDGDRHMRGIGCLLTGIELFPGNIQGGSDTPAGWASGISIDQEIKNYLQSRPETQTRFGSLEFGALVPDRADTWTRMVYAGANKPIAPIDDPYQMFNKLYGSRKNADSLRSVLDDLKTDLQKVKSLVSANDRRMIEDHAELVRGMELELQSARSSAPQHAEPVLEQGVREDNDNMPKIVKMQMDLLVSGLITDAARVATFQFTNSVGQARMKWLGIDEGHHELSHKPDSDKSAQEKLTRINKWYCEQVAYLVKRLADTPEPSGEGSLLDNTLLVWTNELGKGNNHTLNNIPFVLVGGGLDFKMGRSLKFKNEAHHRLLLSLAHGFGHKIDKFGNANYCGAGPLHDLI
ncbi:MAG: DUF1552 domain-containing protein, partial [bacterium]|nr:DUF1552 domain-containing protein [bacterium]